LIINENEDLEPKYIKKCRHINDWSKWKEAIYT